ncbi:MAG: ATP-binding protein [Bacteroidales bacterium]
MRYIFVLFLLLSGHIYAKKQPLLADYEAYLDSANQYHNTEKESFFLQEGLDLARKYDDFRQQSLFLTYLTRNAYNRWIPDSITYWGQMGVQTAKEHEEYALMFDLLSLLCFRELFMENYDRASDQATELYQLGKELNQPGGMIASYEVMGILYRQTSRPKQALASYQEGLNFLKQTQGRLSQELQFIGYIIEILLTQNLPEEAVEYIDQYGRIVNDFETNGHPGVSALYLDRIRMLAACYKTDMFFRKKELKLAEACYLESVKYANRIEDVYVRYYFDLNTVAYHQYITKEYRLALEDIERVMQIEKAPETLLRKADILYDMGRFQESVYSLKDAISMKDSISDYELNTQLNSLRSSLDVNKLELDKKELEAKRNELHIRIFMLSLIFTIIILVILMLVLIRTFRVKNILKKSERELKAAKVKAEESNRMKTVFIQNMSHEIRTPLNAIVGFSSLLAEMPEEAPRFCGVIEENSNVLLKLVDDLLNISVIESKQHTSLNIENVYLNDCCQKAIDSIKGWVRKDVALTFTPEVSRLKMKSDPVRLHQVMTNLLTNASKYTEKGEINLAYNLDKQRRRVRIIVTDTGIGIPQDKRELIFERFVKLDDFKQGTGLGLYISQNIVYTMKGDIFVDPNYDQGARFVVELPLEIEE